MDAISVTGVQGTGKTTLANALGTALGAVVFSRDPLMDVLQAGGVPIEADGDRGLKGYPELGYELLTSLLRAQLELGRSVVLECIAGPGIREQWRQIAEGAGARFWNIDTVCSDSDVHRERFLSREPTQRGDWTLAWHTVEGHRATFRPHPDAVYVADSVRPVEENVKTILGLIL